MICYFTGKFEVFVTAFPFHSVIISIFSKTKIKRFYFAVQLKKGLHLQTQQIENREFQCLFSRWAKMKETISSALALAYYNGRYVSQFMSCD